MINKAYGIGGCFHRPSIADMCIRRIRNAVPLIIIIGSAVLLVVMYAEKFFGYQIIGGLR